jgi:pimeloyl-ACP methyl ester carboxylesterase
MKEVKVFNISMNKNRKGFLLLYCALFFILFIFLIESAAKKSQIEELRFYNSHFMMVEGVELHYRLWYPEGYIPVGHILLLHGLGGSTFSWRFVAPKLAERGYLVLAVDLPGFGLSQRKPVVRQSHKNRANLVWGLIENLDISGTWHLVGHSMGSGVTAAMVLQKPFNTASLTLVAGSIDRKSRKIGSLFFKLRSVRNFTSRVIARLFLTRKRIKSFLSSAYGREPTREEVEGYYQPLQLKDTYLTLASLLRSYKEDKDLDKSVSEIPVPALCLWGREDKWVPLSKGEDLKQKIPNARLVIIDEAKHCPMETHPGIFIQHLIDFLS